MPIRIIAISFVVLIISGCSSVSTANSDAFYDISPSSLPLVTDSTMATEPALTPELPIRTELPPRTMPDEIAQILILGDEAVVDNLFKAVPELNQIAAFIYRQSQEKARMFVQVFGLIDKWGSWYTPVYVGEEWQDGFRAKWHCFYIGDSEDPNDVFVDGFHPDPYCNETLREWRTGETYALQVSQMRDALSIEDDSGRNCIEMGSTEQNVIAYDSDEPSVHETIDAYNAFLRGKSSIPKDYGDYAELRFADDLYGRSGVRKYALFDVNGDNSPELVIQEDRLYVLSLTDGKLCVLYSDEYFGGCTSFVNDGYLYEYSDGMASHTMHRYGKLNGNGTTQAELSLDFYYTYDDDYVRAPDVIRCYNGDGDDEGHLISEAEYDEYVAFMSNDDRIEWHELICPASTCSMVW